jgi:RNA polymerase sigma factor (sigma-70 family)
MSHVAQLVEAQDYARRAVRRIVQDVMETEDVLQDAAMKALGALRRGAFRGESSLKTWFTTIAINQARMALRGRNGQASGRRVFVEVSPELEDGQLSPLRRAEQAQARDRLHAAIRSLAPQMQAEAWAWLAGEQLGEDRRRKSNRHHAKVRLRELLEGAR